jgi:polysaccharide biosynthesis/export protein
VTAVTGVTKTGVIGVINRASRLAISTFLAMLLPCWMPAQQAPSAPLADAYRLQRGDAIEIRVFDIPELTQATVVRPDGQISAILAGNIAAAGMTTSELAQRLALDYGKRFKNPDVSVAVVSFSNQTAYVGGEVTTPGAVSLGGGLSMTAAIFRSGGLKDTSRPDAVVLLRPDQSGTTVQREISVDSILNGTTPDIPLQPGDIIFVPKSTINVYVGGEVTQPGLQTVQGRMTLLGAVLKAGGPLRTGSIKHVILVRDTDGKPSATRYNLDAVLRDATGDMPLRPYDIVFVPKSAIAKVDDFVDDYIRKVIPISLSGGFSYLLNASVIK